LPEGVFAFLKAAAWRTRQGGQADVSGLPGVGNPEHVFHGCCERRAVLRRDAPAFQAPGHEFAFFKTLPTEAREMLSTTSSSTGFPAMSSTRL